MWLSHKIWKCTCVQTSKDSQVLQEKEIYKLISGYQRRQRSAKRFGDMTSSNGGDRAYLLNAGFGPIIGGGSQPGVRVY
jgi:hypothetical protein